MKNTSPLPWDEPGWLEGVAPWVEAQLERLGIEPRGRLELVRTRPWAAVARVATAEGTVWLKEPAPSLAFEPALTAALASRRPDFTPVVLAAEGTLLLTADAGPQLRAVLTSGERAPSWDDLLPRYAELQIELADSVDELLSLGTPDRRPGAVSASYREVVGRVHAADAARARRLRALASELEPLAGLLEGGPLPMTISHEEAHEGNVFVRDGRARLLDWGEATVSHPFAGIANTFRDLAYRRRLRPNGREMLRLRSVYLEPWARFETPAELCDLFDSGYLLGTVCRALSWDRILTGQRSEVRAEYGRNAAVWLELFREGIEEGVRIGA